MEIIGEETCGFLEYYIKSSNSLKNVFVIFFDEEIKTIDVKNSYLTDVINNCDA